MPMSAKSRENETDKTPAVARRVQAYLPSREMRQDFEADAEERGGVSKFVTYLYRRYKLAQSSSDGERKSAA